MFTMEIMWSHSISNVIKFDKDLVFLSLSPFSVCVYCLVVLNSTEPSQTEPRRAELSWAVLLLHFMHNFVRFVFYRCVRFSALSFNCICCSWPSSLSPSSALSLSSLVKRRFSSQHIHFVYTLNDFPCWFTLFGRIIWWKMVAHVSL